MNQSTLTEKGRQMAESRFSLIDNPDQQARARENVSGPVPSCSITALTPIGHILNGPFPVTSLDAPSVFDQIAIVVGHWPCEDGGYYQAFKCLTSLKANNSPKPQRERMKRI